MQKKKSLRGELQKLAIQYETLHAQYQTVELEKKEYEKDVCHTLQSVY